MTMRTRPAAFVSLSAEARAQADQLAEALGWRNGWQVIAVLLTGQLDQVEGRLTSPEYREVLDALIAHLGVRRGVGPHKPGGQP